MNNTWFHGTVYDFKEFDLNELGKSSNSKDAELGFYFGRNKRTAEAYIESGQEINEEEFIKKYSLSIQDVKDKLKETEKYFELKFGITYSEIKDDYSKQFKLKRENQEFRAYFDKINNYNQVLNPYSYDEDSKIVNNYLLGNIFEIELKNDNLLHYDMDNQPWDERKQLEVARQAKLEGFQGVVFQNMQDSGWFGGNGVDDILLVFDVNDISIKGIHEYRKEGITFKELQKRSNKSKLKP